MFNIFQLILISALVIACAAVTCPKAPLYNSTFIGPNCQCASGVQYLCSYSSITLGGTSKWVRGKHVRTLCNNNTPPAKYTPVATFLGPNNAYDHPNLKQHAAVFVSCTSTGIYVYDQYCNNNKYWNIRLIKYSSVGDHNDGANFYTF